MAKYSKEKEMTEEEEEMCEGCGSDHKKPMKEAKTMKSLSPAQRQQMQDEYDMEDDEELEESKKMTEEEEEELEESKSVKESKKMSEQDEEDEDEDEEDEDEDEDEDEEDDMEESFKAIFAGQNLTEDFQMKVTTLFEAAVNSRVKLIENKLASKFTSLLESQVEEIANDLTEKVDSYLNYVVNEWMEENKLAVENGIRTDIAESFIAGLRTLFNEHNITVPEGQTDLLDETANNLQKVSEQLNSQIKKNLELNEKLEVYERARMFAEATEGLSDARVERLRELAEGMDYSSNEEFSKKLAILIENYAPAKAAVSTKQVEDAGEPVALSESTSDVSAYLQAMLRKNK